MFLFSDKSCCLLTLLFSVFLFSYGNKLFICSVNLISEYILQINFEFNTSFCLIKKRYCIDKCKLRRNILIFSLCFGDSCNLSFLRMRCYLIINELIFNRFVFLAFTPLLFVLPSAILLCLINNTTSVSIFSLTFARQ